MQDLYQHINQLYHYISKQTNKIKDLEDTISSIQMEIEQLKSKPSVNVERLEYKFDQLKVETLEGTLNIGLNPTDLKNIEDFAVDQQPANSESVVTPFPQGMRDNIEAAANQYVDKEIANLIQDNEEQLETHIDPQYHELIKNDIKRQLPQRISYYINVHSHPSARQQNPVEQLEEVIGQKIRADIQQAVYTFIAQLPNELKGKKPDGT
ncbi:spore germination protein GerPC [Falsibacillus albus]|uniref:Spore gernimation protein n=1 Tax=Falsibacillus albus TaxID=2478915 RepID=A0A3L7K9C9_9BACI|nr:spore germination protein GerPC [Falsibacillus albus]RLQ97242.1 spore gernimation protein [Falsibacillus albus]